MSTRVPISLIRNGDPLGQRGSVLTSETGRSLARITQRDKTTITVREFRWYERLYFRVVDWLAHRQ